MSEVKSDPQSESAAQRSWSSEENRATVSSYLAMLKKELRGEPYNKTEEGRKLQRLLNGRSEGAIERKHQNISAVLIEAGWVPIEGYKPLANVQASLWAEVERQLRDDTELDRLIQHRVAEWNPPVPPEISNMIESKPPKLPLSTVSETRWHVNGIKRDYLYQEAKNRELGLAGELAAIELEKNRLQTAARPDLVEKIDHVSATIGDGLGYDIRSFDIDGSERFIEVKTTAYGLETPFFVTRNEIEASLELDDRFVLIRIFNFGKKNCGWYQLQGPITESCDNTPVTYIAKPRVTPPN